MRIEQLPNLNQDVPQLIWCCFVANGEYGKEPDSLPCGYVVDLHVRELGIRNCNHGMVQRSYPSRTNADFLYRPHLVEETTEVSHFHRSVGVKHDATEKVLDGSLGGKGHSDTAHTQTCKQSGNVESKVA